MKRNRLLALIILLAAAGIVAFIIIRTGISGTANPVLNYCSASKIFTSHAALCKHQSQRSDSRQPLSSIRSAVLWDRLCLSPFRHQSASAFFGVRQPCRQVLKVVTYTHLEKSHDADYTGCH